MNMYKKSKNENGITLVALIITIILLVILAAVTIKSVVNFGIIDLAAKAAETYSKEQEREMGIIKDLEDLIEYDINGKKFKVELIPEKVTSYKIEVKAKVTRAKAGVESYRFDYKLSNSTEWVQGEEIKSEDEEYKYIYQNLENGKEYHLRAVVKDKEGSEETSRTLIYSTIEGELLAPSITIVGSKNEGYEVQEYYSSEVTVIVTDNGNADTTRASKVKYKVTGAETKEEIVDISEERQISFKVSADGTSEITAYTIDNRGIEIESTEAKIVKIDKEGAKDTKLTFNSKTRDTITVTASGQDETSGIKEYIYQYKETSSNDENQYWNIAETKEENTYTYPNTIIQNSKKYDLRVIITDNAGNKVASPKIEVATNTAPTFKTEAYASSINTNSITISVAAEDTDPEDELTYKLYWGETSSYEGGIEEKKGSSGQEISFSKSSLGNYKLYYWKIEVSDGIEVVKGTETNTRTYCAATYCRGYSTYTYQCSSCSGTGKKTTTSTCSSCSGTGKKTTTRTCSSCSGTGKKTTTRTCGNCTNGKITKRCTPCNGSGKVTTTTLCGGKQNWYESNSWQMNKVCEECKQTSTMVENIWVNCSVHGGIGVSKNCCSTCVRNLRNNPVSSSYACRVTTETNCTNCKGTGNISENCTTCSGTGSISSTTNCTSCKGTGSISSTTNCTNCKGAGSTSSTTNCTSCNGTGSLTGRTSCSHSYTSSHYYCSQHNWKGSASYHT